MFLAFAVAAAACSGSEAIEPSVSGTSPPTISAAPATTETVAETTTTIAVTTTVAPTTTIDEVAWLAGAEAAYLKAWETYHAAIADPGDPDLRKAVADIYTNSGREDVLEILDSYAAANYIARPSPDIPAETRILQGALQVPDEDNVVDLVACEINSELYFEEGSAPGGGDALVSDEVFVGALLVRMRFDGANWKLESGRSDITGLAVESCTL